nr:protein FAR1-RELATED SEQUENCE 9-like [Ipomoea trifida]
MDANAERREGDDTGGEENDQGAIECEMEISPNGTKQWLPTANPEETPYVGQQFKTVEEAILFYQAYARAVGFDVRHGTMRKTREGKVAIKYMVCSREGFKPVNKPKNNAKGVCTKQKKRRRVSKRVGCKARIVITRYPQGGFTCHITGKCIADDECTYRVKENGGGEFEVTTQANVEQARCTCKKFNRMGILCRHVLSVLRNEGVDEIPGEYIVTRWTRNACTRPMHDIWWATTNNSQAQNEARSVANQLWNEFYNCMGLVNGWQEKMEEMLTTLQQLKKEFSKAKQPSNQPNIPDNTIESILGSKPTGDIQIKPPRVAKNKGSGKRLKSTKEKVIEKIKKKPRLCATCRGPGHDSRNCEENKTDEED